MVSEQHLQVGPTTQRLLRDPDYSEWDTLELAEGRRRDRNGKFRGRPPRVIPLTMLHELNKRRVPEVIKTLTEAALPAAKYLDAVARGVEEPDAARINACNIILNRILGAVPQKIQLAELRDNPYERQGVQKAIVLRSAIDVESEEEQPNPYETAHSLPPADEIPDPWEEDPSEDNPFEDTGNPVYKGRPQRK